MQDLFVDTTQLSAQENSVEPVVFIYRFSNNLNGKIYIGQTNNPPRRYYQYKHKVKIQCQDQVIYRALIKYGFDNFKFELLAMCEGREQANMAEHLFINMFEATNPQKGYNVDIGGGFTRTTQTNKRISEALLRFYKCHQSPLKGLPFTEEHKKAISEASMGKPGTNTGKQFSTEWKVKISNANAGKESKRRFTPEQEKEICNQYKAGTTTYLLAKQYNCYSSLIRGMLIRNKIEIRNPNNNKHTNKLSSDKQKELCSLYTSGSETRNGLSKKFDCSSTTVRNILLKNGVELKRKVSQEPTTKSSEEAP